MVTILNCQLSSMSSKNESSLFVRYSSVCFFFCRLVKYCCRAVFASFCKRAIVVCNKRLLTYVTTDSRVYDTAHSSGRVVRLLQAMVWRNRHQFWPALLLRRKFLKLARPAFPSLTQSLRFVCDILLSRFTAGYITRLHADTGWCACE